MIDMKEIESLAMKFWIKNGKNPTHLLITTSQLKDLGVSLLSTDDLITYATGKYSKQPSIRGSDTSVLQTIQFPHFALNIIPVDGNISGMNYGGIDIPMVINAKDEY